MCATEIERVTLWNFCSLAVTLEKVELSTLFPGSLALISIADTHMHRPSQPQIELVHRVTHPWSCSTDGSGVSLNVQFSSCA